MQRILVVRFSSFGDVVLLSALLEEFRRRQPEAELWLVTKPAYAGFYEDDPRVDHLLTLDPARGGLRALRRQLAAQEFDLVLDAHGSLRSRLLCLGLSGGPLRRIQKDTAARLLYLRTHIATPALQRHQVDRYLALVDAEGQKVRPRILVHERARTSAVELLGHEPSDWLAIAPGARHATKRWPLERYAEIAREFQASGRGHVVLMGSPEEREMCEQLAQMLPEEAVVAAGKLSLRASAAVLERARLLVCNDSGLMHLSEAVGTPVLAVFGPTSRELGILSPGSAQPGAGAVSAVRLLAQRGGALQARRTDLPHAHLDRRDARSPGGAVVMKDRREPAGIPAGWFTLYNTLIAPLGALGFQFSQFSSAKVRQGVEGRKGLWRRLEAAKDELRGCVWFHATSVGEYEQARPILRALREEALARGERVPVLLTVFSPSGYNFAQGHEDFDRLEYLPLDSWPSAWRMVGILQRASGLRQVRLLAQHDLGCTAQEGSGVSAGCHPAATQPSSEGNARHFFGRLFDSLGPSAPSVKTMPPLH